MSKLVEAASEFLGRDTFNKGDHRDFSEAMHPMKKKMEAMHPMNKKMEAMHPMKKSKKEMDESFLLSQEEFQSLSEDDQEHYVNQLMELKKAAMEAMHPAGMHRMPDGTMMKNSDMKNKNMPHSPMAKDSNMKNKKDYRPKSM
jgi:hypothetical protein